MRCLGVEIVLLDIVPGILALTGYTGIGRPALIALRRDLACGLDRGLALWRRVMLGIYRHVVRRIFRGRRIVRICLAHVFSPADRNGSKQCMCRRAGVIFRLEAVHAWRAFAMGYTTQGIRNIALVGSAGAGKTLLLEALLLQAGAIRNKGNLQRGGTVSDFDPQEKRLQHSLDPAICRFDYNSTHINVIDTPGYPD